MSEGRVGEEQANRSWRDAFRVALFYVAISAVVADILYTLSTIGNADLNAKYEQGYAHGQSDCHAKQKGEPAS